MNPIDLLIVALVCGVFARALTQYAPKAVPAAGLAVQGVLGVYTGLMVHNVSFAALGSHWPIVVAVALGTLVISIAGGALLGLHPGVSPLTGGLSLVAGGSSGVVAIARELGGDDRVVAAVQYLRVALITAAMPVVVTVFYHDTKAHGSQISETASLPWYFSLPLIAVIVVVGAAAGRFVRLPGAGLLGPMAITIVLDLTGLDGGSHGSDGAGPGRNHADRLADRVWVHPRVAAGDQTDPAGAFALIMVLNVASAGLGAVLAQVAGLSELDGYLATSPGGVYAVLGTAVESGSNVTFVMAAQVIRIVLMLFAAPFVARLFIRFTSQAPGDEPARRELVPVAA